MKMLFLNCLRCSIFCLLFPALAFLSKDSSGCAEISKITNGNFSRYTETIPGSKVSFEMIPVRGGKGLMGSPASQKGHRQDEGPVHTVVLDSFWMGKYEVTWDEFELFVYPAIESEKAKANEKKGLDGVTTPTMPITDMSFGMGKAGYPAVNMTQYAALAYCKWLTAKTGHFYRLPTEAEWEYACRAGTQTAYSFGNDPAKLPEYAWYSKNSNDKYHKPGSRKPNPWGLYDMHGNVSEWTLDQYIPGFYSDKKALRKNPWAVPDKLYPRAVRGGSWNDDPEDLRSAARRGSSPRWKQRDPQIPKSDWWNTDASFVGFRVVRPLKKPSAKEIDQYFSRPIADM